ncbi:hypothetical protein ABE042_20370 [Viridibacillus arvi]|jgi:spore coat protein B|uniref:Spore coat protein n=1 Tax=Viridibacillus arvi TaxID=263475 RepID=A0A0M0LEK1_9BACL|nr:hypothetical protein [Viridibacillus arvi]KOO49510.1 hypothetical protein AMD00_14230 [Viridibacillus arvi]
MNKEIMLSLLHKVIKVDRGGPESRIGFLLAAEDDYFALLTEADGVTYYRTQHVKSITIDAKEGLKFALEIPENFEYITGGDFSSILNSLKYSWIKVNRGGPEMLEGVLDEVGTDYVIIIANEEVIRLSMFHIRSLSYGAKVEKVKGEEKEGDSSAKKKEARSESSSKENE